ncbi:MAG: choice-of-anchor Q domain-containing protein [Thermoleophilia bacterium]
MSRHRRVRVLLVLCVSGLTAGQAAAAVTRYASPTGGATPSECTDPNAPCTLAVALAHPGAGDTISLAGGPYDMQAIPLPAVPLNWVATDPAARPTLTSAGPMATLNLGFTQSGTVVDGVDVNNTHTPTNVAAISVAAGTSATVRNATITGGSCIDAPDSGPLTIERATLTSRVSATCMVLGHQSVVRSSTVGRTNGLVFGTPPPSVTTQGLVEDTTVTGGLQLLDGGAVARRVSALGFTAIWGQGLVVDSLARSVATNGVGIAADAPVGGTLRVVNVTAIAPNGVGLLSRSVQSTSPQVSPNLLDVTNAISRGGTADVQATAGITCMSGNNCALGLVHIDHSNFVTRDPAADSLLASTLLEGPGNQSGDPHFTNAAALDFHPLTGSPTIDAGVVVADALPTDLDGRARVQGTAPDLGAYEREVPPVGTPPGGGTGGGGAGGGTGATTSGATAPVLGAVRLSRTHLRAVPHGATGTKVRWTLTPSLMTTSVSATALVKVTIQRAAVGVRAGARCLRPNPRSRARRCTRWLSLTPALAQKLSAAGEVRVRFTARLGGRVLPAGRYRLRVQAVDVAGRNAVPRTVGFTVAHR